MNGFLKDVISQPESLRKAIEGYLSGDNAKRMDEIADLGFEKVVFTGMGSSNFCNGSAEILLNNSGFTSMVKSTGQLLYYETGLLRRDTLFILVSQSGESAEIVRLLDSIPPFCTIVAVTNNGNSTLAKRANYLFHMNVEEEEAVSTRTYLAALVLQDLLAASIAKCRNEIFVEGIRASVEGLASFLEGYEEVYGQLKDFLKEASYLCLAGRGHSMATVRSGALFIREVAKFPGIDFDSAEFRHGPFEMVQPGFHGMIFAPGGPSYELNCRLASNIAEKGGKVVLVTNRPTGRASDKILVLEQKKVPEMLVPIPEIAPVQLAAAGLAEIRGFEAGKFRWSSKVTRFE